MYARAAGTPVVSRMVTQGEKLVGAVRGNLRILSYDEIYAGDQEGHPKFQHEFSVFECDWFEKLVEERVIIDPRNSEMYYYDLYIMCKDGRYTAVKSFYTDDSDSATLDGPEFKTETFPWCATIKELAKILKESGSRLPKGALALVEAYDPVWNAPK